MEGVPTLGRTICKQYAYLILFAVLCVLCCALPYYLPTHSPLLVQTKLVEYKKAYGTCNVPRGYTEDLSLGRWVNSQRTMYKYFKAGEYANGMNKTKGLHNWKKLDFVGYVVEQYVQHDM